MKKILFLLTCCLVTATLSAQSAYYDALYLSRLDLEDFSDITIHSNPYVKSDTGNLTITEFKDLFNKKVILVKDSKGNDITKYLQLDEINGKGIQTFLNTATNDRLVNMDSYRIADTTGNAYFMKEAPYVFNKNELAQINAFQTFLKDPFVNLGVVLDLALLKEAVHKYNAYVEGKDEDIKVSPFIAGGLAPILTTIPELLSNDGIGSTANQSKLLDGLVKYNAEQFKKAQLLTYMNLFESTIGKVGELQVLLPETYQKLKTADPSKFPDLGDEYKEVFERDLKNLLENLVEHIDSHGNSLPTSVYSYQVSVNGDNKAPYYYIQDTDEMKGFDSTLVFFNGGRTSDIRATNLYKTISLLKDLAGKLSSNYQVTELLEYLDVTYYNATGSTSRKVNESIPFVFHGINLLQKNLRDTARTSSGELANTWLSLTQLSQIDTERELEFFAGLIYQKDPEYFKKLFFPNAPKPDLTDFKKKVFKLLSLLTEIQEFRKAIDSENESGNFVKYMEMIVNLIERSELVDDDLTQGLRVAEHVVAMYDNIQDKDYSNSLYHVLNIFELMLNGDQKTKLITAIQKIEKYTTFMSDVVKAESSDEVKELITKHVAPPSTFMLKRERRSTFSLGSHPGYFISTEELESGGSGFVSGITMPLGFEFSLKSKWGQDNAGSWSVMLQLLDLGAMLNFRIDNSTSDLPEQVKFSQVFSPGGSVNYGFKNSPFTIGVGYQRTPELRKVTAENIETFTKGDRFFIRAGWDIPLINIAKSKKR